MKLSNDSINALALTCMIKAGKVTSDSRMCGTYKDFVKQGWSFYFEKHGDSLIAVMEGEFVGQNRMEAPVESEMQHTILSILQNNHVGESI